MLRTCFLTKQIWFLDTILCLLRIIHKWSQDRQRSVREVSGDERMKEGREKSQPILWRFEGWNSPVFHFEIFFSHVVRSSASPEALFFPSLLEDFWLSHLFPLNWLSLISNKHFHYFKNTSFALSHSWIKTKGRFHSFLVTFRCQKTLYQFCPIQNFIFFSSLTLSSSPFSKHQSSINLGICGGWRILSVFHSSSLSLSSSSNFFWLRSWEKRKRGKWPSCSLRQATTVSCLWSLISCPGPLWVHCQTCLPQ